MNKEYNICYTVNNSSVEMFCLKSSNYSLFLLFFNPILIIFSFSFNITMNITMKYYKIYMNVLACDTTEIVFIV